MHIQPEYAAPGEEGQRGKEMLDIALYTARSRHPFRLSCGFPVPCVVVRIVLDPSERHDFSKLGDLADNVRIKQGGSFMHLKAYAIDGELLRTGSANFAASGDSQQDNDLVAICVAGAAAKFEASTLTHLRQLDILTPCFTSTFRAEKATWHYITFSDCISELGAAPPLILRRDDPCRASVAALGGREGPASVARVCRSARRRSDSRNVAPTESQL